MEIFAIGCGLLVVIVRWLQVSSRLNDIEARLDALSSVAPTPVAAPAPPVVVPPRPAEHRPEPAPAPPVRVVVPSPRPTFIPLPPTFEPPPPSNTEDWEATLGGNWLNKLGVFVLVIGLALALGYSFTHIGPLGRVLTSIVLSVAMLVTGAVLEDREDYRTFARGLLGGGWAALYVTVYAMHHIEAARVVDNPAVEFFLLFAVAGGMILHSLRYHSQTATGLAYFVAFGTLALTQLSTLPLVAMIPLAISLLYLAHRFDWPNLVPPALVFTYAICVLRGDESSTLAQAQMLFAAYWLLFEVFDILHPAAWLMPLNAVGFLGLSLMKWQDNAPGRLWMFLAASAAAYLAGTVLRRRAGRWHGAATLTAGLAAAAIFQKLEHQWIVTALVVEAELFYLAGVRLRARWLRWIGSSLFVVELARLLLVDPFYLGVASLDAVLFYANRAIDASEALYGFAGAGMLAVIIGKEFDDPNRTLAWFALAAVSFALGWWRRLLDFRAQAYLVGVLGLMSALAETYRSPLAVAAVFCYAAVLCAERSPERFLEEERPVVHLAASVASTVALATLAWRIVPEQYVGLAWLALAIVVFELGLRRQSYALAASALFPLWQFNLVGLQNDGPLIPRAIPAAAAVLCYAFAFRARSEEDGRVFAGAASAGTILSIVGMWSLLPTPAVGPAWAGFALALFLTGKREARWAARAIASLAFVRCWWFILDTNLAPAVIAIAVFYAIQLLSERASHERIYYSLLGTKLLTLLLWYQISGSMLTVAWGIEGTLLLASGFPLRDRILRISGLGILLLCISKLFLWDLRHLETLPRIFSFIVLGLMLVGVSWIYTRYREHVARYL